MNQRDLNAQINTYTNFQSKANRYEEKSIVPVSVWRPTVVFPVVSISVITPEISTIIYPTNTTVQFNVTLNNRESLDHIVWTASAGNIDSNGLWTVEQVSGIYTITAASFLYPSINISTTIRAIPETTVIITSPV